MDEEFVILGIFGGFFFLLAFHVFVKGCERVLSQWRDVSLKMRLVEEGFRADEIEQVVNAGRRLRKCAKPKHQPPVREPAFAKHA